MNFVQSQGSQGQGQGGSSGLNFDDEFDEFDDNELDGLLVGSAEEKKSNNKPTKRNNFEMNTSGSQ